MLQSRIQSRELSNMRRISRAGAKLIVLVMIINQIFHGDVIVANIIQTDDPNQLMIASNHNSPTSEPISNEPRVHPYGSSFEAIDKSRPEEREIAQTDPMNTAASYYHHHSGGAKGWLDMGAWTKKKGAFGWYAEYPVGKGKK